MSAVISANELKTKGISLINKVTDNNTEAVITVRGKSEYVILPIKLYNKLREYELEAALKETRENIKKGNFIEETVEKHIKRVTRV